MMSMTDTNFDTTAHPRSARSGQFVEASHTAPETTLAAPAAALRDPGAQRAIDAVTGGRSVLEAAVNAGAYDHSALITDRQKVWEHAGGAKARALTLEQHLAALDEEITADNVERILEVAYHRARSGRYATDEDGTLSYTLVSDGELRSSDWQAEALGTYVTGRWEAGESVGPEAEVTEDTARLFAEDAIGTLALSGQVAKVPLLAEFANQPFTEQGDATPEKVDAFRDEIAFVRNSHDYLSPRRSARLDMLATYAAHATPGQN